MLNDDVSTSGQSSKCTEMHLNHPTLNYAGAEILKITLLKCA